MGDLLRERARAGHGHALRSTRSSCLGAGSITVRERLSGGERLLRRRRRRLFVPELRPSVFSFCTTELAQYCRLHEALRERPAFAKAFGGGHANAVLAACDNAGQQGEEKLFGLF